jgi:hypothetical protein
VVPESGLALTGVVGYEDYNHVVDDTTQAGAEQPTETYEASYTIGFQDGAESQA